MLQILALSAFLSLLTHTDSSAGLKLILHDCLLKRDKKKKKLPLFLFLDYGTVSDDLGLISLSTDTFHESHKSVEKTVLKNSRNPVSMVERPLA